MLECNVNLTVYLLACREIPCCTEVVVYMHGNGVSSNGRSSYKYKNRLVESPPSGCEPSVGFR